MYGAQTGVAQALPEADQNQEPKGFGAFHVIGLARVGGHECQCKEGENEAHELQWGHGFTP